MNATPPPAAAGAPSLTPAALAGALWALWERSRQDPWQRLLLRARERLARAGLPVVLTMEGGYAVAEVGVNVVNVLEGFMAAAG